MLGVCAWAGTVNNTTTAAALSILMTLSFGTLTLRFRQDTTGSTPSPSRRAPTFGSTPANATGLAGFRAVFVARRRCSLRHNDHYNTAATISGGETGVHATAATSNGIRH